MSKWKIYIKITDLGAISRRYFVNNFYDGMLTIIGVILGSFILFLNGDDIISELIIIPGLSTSITMFISGFSGSFLSEKAEQNKIKKEIRKAMGEFEEKGKDLKPKETNEEELKKAMLMPIHLKKTDVKKKKKKNIKTF